MHKLVILGLLSLGGVVQANPEATHMSLTRRGGLSKRQIVTYCSGNGTTCESQCGPGYITCASYPNCFNPGKGEVCCSDGDFCEAGETCLIGGYCCGGNSGVPCGASSTLATLTGALPSSTQAAASSSMPGEAAGRKVANAAGAALGALVLGMPFL